MTRRKLGARQPPDLTGQRFGELTVEGLAEQDTDRRGRVWRCRCSCGAPALRTTAVLRYSSKKNQSPCCAACRDKLFARMQVGRRKIRIAEWLSLWRWSSTLWSERALAQLTDEIRQDIEEDQGAFLVVERARSYEVVNDGEWDEEDHLAAERSDDQGMTYAAMGSVLGLSRARVQQLVADAMRQFRLNWMLIFPMEPQAQATARANTLRAIAALDEATEKRARRSSHLARSTPWARLDGMDPASRHKMPSM